jgi:hypothetical protein
MNTLELLTNGLLVAFLLWVLVFGFMVDKNKKDDDNK